MAAETKQAWFCRLQQSMFRMTVLVELEQVCVLLAKVKQVWVVLTKRKKEKGKSLGGAG